MNITSDNTQKVIVAITGASGSMYGRVLIEQLLLQPNIAEIAVVFSEAGRQVWDHERQGALPADPVVRTMNVSDFFSPPSSGSAGYSAMFVAPCSMGTLGHIASGTSANLIHRAADVMLKERRPLILLVREAPFNLIHIENMAKVTRSGAVVFPASPFFYHHPETLESLVGSLVSRMLSLTHLGKPSQEWGNI